MNSERTVLADALDSYGKTGPYGETLWYLLSSLKQHFLELLQAEWSESFGPASDPMLIRILLEKRINETRKRLRTEKESWAREICNYWPPQRDFDQAELERIAEARWQLFDDYLVRCRTFLGMISPQHGEDTSKHKLARARREADSSTSFARKTLMQAVGSLIWPYYFVRAPRTDKIITWMPSFELMRTSCGPEGFQDIPGNLLYPSLYGLLDEESIQNTPARKVLSEDLRAWVDLSSIGHVQPLQFGDSTFTNAYLPDVTSRAYPNSRFSDLFYFNREAYRWFEWTPEDRPEDRSVCGVVFWCSPIDGLLLDLMRPNPDSLVTDITEIICEKDFLTLYSDRVRTLGELTHKAWQASKGPIVGGALRKRFEVTEHDLLLPKDKEIKRMNQVLAWWLPHDLINFLNDASIDDPSEEVSARHLCIKVFMDAVLAFNRRGAHYVLWEDLFRKKRDDVTPVSMEQVLNLTFRHKLQSKKLDLSLNFDGLIGSYTNKLLPAVLLELARNICRHVEEGNGTYSPSGQVKARVQGQDGVVITARSGLHAIERMNELYQSLPTNQDSLPLKGVAFILELLRAMSSSGSPAVEWRFIPEGSTNSSLEADAMTVIEPDSDIGWRIAVPSFSASFVRSDSTMAEIDKETLGWVEFSTAPLSLGIKQ